MFILIKIFTVIIFFASLISLVYLLVKPNVLKFILKRPTRLKAIGVWYLSFFILLIAVCIAWMPFTPKSQKERLQEKETYNYYSKPDTTTKKPFRVFPLR